ncbi:MAG: hypothetical protein ACJ74W_12115 [Pyrinomonadaceae bacterium]
MTNEYERKRVSTLRLIAGPVLLSVVVTLVRLIGELQHWSPSWFNAKSGGVLPSGVSWVIGIVWLPLPFGIYFALQLVRMGRGPRNAGRAVGLAVLAILLLGVFFKLILLHLSFLGDRSFLLLIWLVGVGAGALQWFGWRDLCKTLIAYGLASRAVVVVVMLLAQLGHWGTHYDYGQDAGAAEVSFAFKFWWLSFFPQFVFWVGFTVALGALSGSITYALARRRQVAEPAAAVS